MVRLIVAMTMVVVTRRPDQGALGVMEADLHLQVDDLADVTGHHHLTAHPCTVEGEGVDVEPVVERSVDEYHLAFARTCRLQAGHRGLA